MLLDYASTYYNSILRYNDRRIIIQIESDTAYRVMMEARSWYAGHLYLIYFPQDNLHKSNPWRNGSIIMTCKTILNVVTSADEL